MTLSLSLFQSEVHKTNMNSVWRDWPWGWFSPSLFDFSPMDKNSYIAFIYCNTQQTKWYKNKVWTALKGNTYGTFSFPRAELHIFTKGAFSHKQLILNGAKMDPLETARCGRGLTLDGAKALPLSLYLFAFMRLSSFGLSASLQSDAEKDDVNPTNRVCLQI